MFATISAVLIGAVHGCSAGLSAALPRQIRELASLLPVKTESNPCLVRAAVPTPPLMTAEVSLPVGL